MSDIPTNQIAYKRRIGSLNGDPVIEVGLRGGLHIVLMVHGNKTETVGTGAHRCIARHIAKKHYPAIKFTDLAKADYVSVEHYLDLLPKYEALTLRFRELEGS
jgi:hypothetical protein